MKIRDDFECAQYVMEKLLDRPTSTSEIEFVFSNIQSAWPMIMEKVSSLGANYDLKNRVLIADGKRWQGESLFRCLEKFFDKTKAIPCS